METSRLTRWVGWSKWWLLIPVLLLLIQISAIPYMQADSVPYLSMAQSLNDNGVMLKLGSPHLVYAVGYPAVLSGVLAFHGNPFLTSSILNAVLGLIFLVGVWLWCKQVAPSQAVWLSCLAVCNVTVLYIFRRPLSEPLFMALLIWSSVFLNHAVKQLPLRIDWVSIGIASVLLAMLVATRQVGVFLVAGLVTWLGCLIWKRTIPLKLGLYAACLPMLASGMTLLALIHHEQQTKKYAPTHSHWDMLLGKSAFASEHREENFAEYLLEGFRIRVYEIGRLVIPGMFGCYAKTGEWLNVNTLIYLPIAALVFYGRWRLARHQSDSLILMFPWYFALYVYWPCDQGGRFFAPILPLLFLSLWKGLSLMPSFRNRWILRGLVLSHATIAVILWLSADLRHYHNYELEGEDVSNCSRMLKDTPHEIGTDDNSSWSTLYLEHLLDRVIQTYNGAKPPQFLLWPVNRELPPGYCEISAGKCYRLARIVGDIQ